MGFDLYGLNPQNPNNAIRPEQMDWNKNPSDKEPEAAWCNIPLPNTKEVELSSFISVINLFGTLMYSRVYGIATLVFSVSFSIS